MLDSKLFSEFAFTTAKTLGDNSGKSYVIIDTQNSQFPILYCNESYRNLINFDSSDLIGHSIFDVVLPSSMDPKHPLSELDKGSILNLGLQHIRKNSDSFLAEIECIPFQSPNGDPFYSLMIVEDVSYTKIELLINAIEKQLFDAIEREASLAEKLFIICKEMDNFFHPLIFTSYILPNNQNELLAVTKHAFSEEFNGVQFTSHPLQDPYHQVLLQKTSLHVHLNDFNGVHLIDEHRQYALKQNMTNCYLLPICNINDSVVGLFAIYHSHLDREQTDIKTLNEKIESLISIAHMYSDSQQRIYELSHVDHSTGLANYTQFMETLDAAFEEGKTGYVKLLKLDDYSNIVALYGRDAVDQLLKQVAARYQALHTKNELHIARFSGTSLIILHIMSSDELNNIVFNERIREFIRQPYKINDLQAIYLTLKAGIATFDNEPSYSDVIQKVESALEYAKKQTGTSAVRYTIEKRKEVERQILIEHYLHFAIEHDELSIYLQPKVNLNTGQISSLEALVRWQSPELGFVLPDEFLPIAEKIGKIREVDNIVIKHVLRWLKERHHNNKKMYRIAVNIAPNHFYAPNFVNELYEMVTAQGISPRLLIIEVTEHTGLVDSQKAIDIMEQLKRYGFDISVDDFGVGYSSLSYLQKFPFDELKIDRSFISKINEAGTEAVVRAIVELANFFDMEVVAEGIETEAQREILQTLGRKTGQGYLFYKPIPLDEVDSYLD